MKLKSLEQRPSRPRDTAVRLRHAFAQRADRRAAASSRRCSTARKRAVDRRRLRSHPTREPAGAALLREESAVTSKTTYSGACRAARLRAQLARAPVERASQHRCLSARRRHARATFTALPTRDGRDARELRLARADAGARGRARAGIGRPAGGGARARHQQPALGRAQLRVHLAAAPERRIARSRPHVEELQSSAWRAAALASGLKLLGRKRGNEPELLRLDELLEGDGAAAAAGRGGVKLEIRLPRNVPEVRVPRAHAEQLLLIVTFSAAGRARANSTIALAVDATAAGPAGDAGSIRVTWQFRPGARHRRAARARFGAHPVDPAPRASSAAAPASATTPRASGSSSARIQR